MKIRKRNIKKLDDEAIIGLYKKTGDKQLIGELFDRYGKHVYGVCLKYLKDVSKAQDASTMIFEKLMDDLKEVDVRKFRPWLHVVSRNHCLMKLRKEGKFQKTELERVEFGLMSEDNLREVELKEEQLQLLESALHDLKPEQKKCIELFYLKQLCYQEIADTTGYTMKQVKSYIQNGKRNLRILLEDKPEFRSS